MTRCPKLDPVFKTASEKPEAKSADTELARIQVFVHDPVGPMVQLLQKMEEETEFPISLDDARVALSDAIKLLGNASAQISKLRRKKMLKAVNPAVFTMYYHLRRQYVM